MPYWSILFIVCCAVFYYRLGESEYESGFLLASISVALWLIGSLALGWGSASNLLVQIGFFLALWIWNATRK